MLMSLDFRCQPREENEDLILPSGNTVLFARRRSDRRSMAMKQFPDRAVLSLAILLVVCGTGTAFAQQPPSIAPVAFDFTVVKPESVGFSSERVERLHALMQQTVEQKQLPRAVTILARHGKVIDYRAYGQRDLGSGAPMTKDAIFRAFSMTKPITGVAMMILYEQEIGRASCRER